MRLKAYLFAIVFYFLLTVMIFPEIYFENRVFFFGDNYSLLVPGKIFTAEQFKQNIIPFWNPYLFSGTPFMADTGNSVFYPSTLLFLFLTPAAGVNTTIIFSLILAALGTFYASRVVEKKWWLNLLAGALWIFSEPLIAATSNIAILQTMSWLPWILGLFLRTFSNQSLYRFMPFFIFMSFLGGHPQTLAYLIFGMFVYLLFARQWKSLGIFCTAGLVTGLLLLFVLAPLMEVGSLSTRHSAALDQKVDGSLKLSHLIHFVIPNFWSSPLKGMVWGPDWDRIRMVSGYMSLPVLAGFIFLLFRLVRKYSFKKIEVFLLFLTLGSLLFSLAGSLPFVARFIMSIPIINSFRNPAAALGLYTLSLSLLLPVILRNLSGLISSKLFKLSLVFLLVIGGIWWMWQTQSRNMWNYIDQTAGLRLSMSTLHTYERDRIIGSVILKQLMLSASVMSGVFWLVSKKRWPLFIGLLLLTDVYFSHRQFLFFAPQSIYSFSSPQSEWLKKNAPSLTRSVSTSSYLNYVGFNDYWNNIYIRPPFGDSLYTKEEAVDYQGLLARAKNLGATWNVVHGQELVNGYATFVLKDVAAYWQADAASQVAINDVTRVELTDIRLDDVGAAYILIDKLPTQKDIPGEASIFPVVHETDTYAIAQRTTAKPTIRFASASGSIETLPSSINEIKFVAETTSVDDILIKKTMYPGWECRVDGQPYQIIKDGFTMRVKSMPGKHTYHLTFTPTGWRYLIWISGLSWVIFLGFLGKSLINRNKS